MGVVFLLCNPKTKRIYYKAQSNQKYPGVLGINSFPLEMSSVVCCALATNRKTKYMHDSRRQTQLLSSLVRHGEQRLFVAKLPLFLDG
jgi:hypothetical protein